MPYRVEMVPAGALAGKLANLARLKRGKIIGLGLDRRLWPPGIGRPRLRDQMTYRQLSFARFPLLRLLRPLACALLLALAVTGCNKFGETYQRGFVLPEG